jgi:hypothetical protein
MKQKAAREAVNVMMYDVMEGSKSDMYMYNVEFDLGC